VTLRVVAYGPDVERWDDLPERGRWDGDRRRVSLERLDALWVEENSVWVEVGTRRPETRA